MRLTSIALSSTLALTGCGTSGEPSAPALRRIVGTDLVGATGATTADQRRIDRTVVGLCGGKIWTPDECARHGRTKGAGAGNAESARTLIGS